MNGRGGVVRFFIFLLVSIIILLQIVLMVRSDRLHRAANQLEQAFKDTSSEYIAEDQSRPSGAEPDAGCAGDEGDWLVWAFRVEPRTLNPISAEADAYTAWITVPNIFEPLLNYDYSDAKLKPWLAESYKVSTDGLEVTFHLRDGIHFSDGAPVTADDVVFTFEAFTNPEICATSVVSQCADIARVVKLDERAVKFYMERPYLGSDRTLSFAGRAGILPKHLYEFSDSGQFNKRVSNPVGSGPYVFEKWDVGEALVLRRNENYLGTKPKLKKMVYRFISNAAASVQALRAHEVDIIIPEPEQFSDLANDEEFNKEFRCLSYWTARTPLFYVGWNQKRVFFKDRRVRQAMTHIIDREEIVSRLLKGYGRVITGPFYFDGPHNDPNIKPWPYDLGRAGELLDEAGWVDSDGDGLRDKDGVPFRFEFMYSTGYALYERLARLLKDQMVKVGIELAPEPCEWSVLFGRLNDRAFDAYVAGWAADTAENPYELWHSSQISIDGANYVGFCSKQADQIIEGIATTLDRTERTRLYHRLGRILHEEQAHTFLFTRPSLRILDRRFKNVTIYRLGLNYAEWYVPKQEQRYK